MQPQDMILVSVDDHLVEPLNLFEGKLPSKFSDDGPKVVRLDDGLEVWTFNGAIIPTIGLNAVAGRPREEQCTVGALRAEARDHDVAIRSFDHGRFERTVGASLGSMGAKLDV